MVKRAAAVFGSFDEYAQIFPQIFLPCKIIKRKRADGGFHIIFFLLFGGGYTHFPTSLRAAVIICSSGISSLATLFTATKASMRAMPKLVRAEIASFLELACKG